MLSHGVVVVFVEPTRHLAESSGVTREV